MKKISAGLFMALLTVGLLSARGDDKKVEDKSDLKALDAKLTQAFKDRDFTLLGKHMEDSYLVVDPRGGLHNKEQYLKYLSESAPKFKDLTETDVKARVKGETGIVTGLLHVKGDVDNKGVAVQYRWTRVYDKKGDEWVCIFEQHTQVVPKEAGK
jgi:ketosteroid isomerase-like protein